MCEYYPPGNVVGQYLSNVQSRVEEGIQHIVGDDKGMDGGSKHDQGGGQDTGGGSQGTRGGSQHIQGGLNDAVTSRRVSWVGVTIGIGTVLLFIK